MVLTTAGVATDLLLVTSFLLSEEEVAGGTTIGADVVAGHEDSDCVDPRPGFTGFSGFRIETGVAVGPVSLLSSDLLMLLLLLLLLNWPILLEKSPDARFETAVTAAVLPVGLFSCDCCLLTGAGVDSVFSLSTLTCGLLPCFFASCVLRSSTIHAGGDSVSFETGAGFVEVETDCETAAGLPLDSMPVPPVLLLLLPFCSLIWLLW